MSRDQQLYCLHRSRSREILSTKGLELSRCSQTLLMDFNRKSHIQNYHWCFHRHMFQGRRLIHPHIKPSNLMCRSQMSKNSQTLLSSPYSYHCILFDRYCYGRHRSQEIWLCRLHRQGCRWRESLLSRSNREGVLYSLGHSLLSRVWWSRRMFRCRRWARLRRFRGSWKCRLKRFDCSRSLEVHFGIWSHNHLNR